MLIFFIYKMHFLYICNVVSIFQKYSHEKSYNINFYNEINFPHSSSPHLKIEITDVFQALIREKINDKYSFCHNRMWLIFF